MISKTRRTSILLISAALFAIPCKASDRATLSGLATVIDGDTIEIGAARIRLYGMDAAELGQKCERPSGRPWSCDEAATNLLVELTAGREVECEIQNVDPYGRLVSICTSGGVNLGETLVEDGLAWAFIQYSTDYAGHEAAARQAGLGIWRDGAEPTTPWAYRADRWERAAAASPQPGCPIKGNISSSGEKIYHTPWSPWYSRTKINESAGEAWFCDEAEAIGAGWRPARSK